MAKKKNGGKLRRSIQAVPEEAKYNPEERLASAAALGQQGIQCAQADPKAAYDLLQESCRQLEQIQRDGAHAGRFDDSKTDSGYRGKQYREWICGRCAEKLAVQHKAMADCALQQHQKDLFAQSMVRMVACAGQADLACKTKETREVLFSSLTAAGDWCLHQLEPPDPKRAYQHAFRVLRLAEQADTWGFHMEETVLRHMESAAKTVCESVAMAPALGGNLVDSFSGVLPLAKTYYSRQHYLAYADLEANLVEWMLDHGKSWHGLWEGRDYPLESVYSATAEALIDAGVMAENEPFRRQVLRVLGKMQDVSEQLKLTEVIQEYCSRHQRPREIEASTRLLEDTRDAVSQGGKYNCHPLVWLYLQMMLSNLYFDGQRYDDTDAVAVETLQDVAELRREEDLKGKWAARENRTVAPILRHMINMVESDAYVKRASVCNHYMGREEVLAYLDQADAVMDRAEETDRRVPEWRQKIQFLRQACLGQLAELRNKGL